MRHQRTLVLVLFGVASILAFYVVVARQFAYGPVLLAIGDTHGVHLADLPVLGLWALAAVAAFGLWRPPPS